MKNNLLPFIAITFFIALSSISCSKQNDALITQQTLQNYQTDIVGSWQLAENGVETEFGNMYNYLYDNHFTENKMSTTIKWENAKVDESQDFKQNGEYSCYLKKQLGCKGAYRISNEGDLDINSNCQNNSVKITGLTTIFLTIKDGNHYFKYRKID